MQEEPLSSAIAKLRVLAAEHPDGACAFDGDGTLWSGDVGEDYLAHLLEEDAFTDEASRLFASEAERFGVAKTTAASDQLAALFRAYTEGKLAEDRICGLIALAVAGRTSEDVAKVAEEVVRLRDVRGRLHDETLEFLNESKKLGLLSLLVSASPQPIVVAAARVLGGAGLDAGDVIAVTPHEENGRVTTSLLLPIPYGEGKAQRLAERLGDRVLVACAGDNAFDLPMLAKARLPLAIRPKERLRAIAHELPGLRILGQRPKAN